MDPTGLQVVETTGAKALFGYVTKWSDVLKLETTPLVEVPEAAEVPASLCG